MTTIGLPNQPPMPGAMDDGSGAMPPGAGAAGAPPVSAMVSQKMVQRLTPQEWQEFQSFMTPRFIELIGKLMPELAPKLAALNPQQQPGGMPPGAGMAPPPAPMPMPTQTPQSPLRNIGPPRAM